MRVITVLFIVLSPLVFAGEVGECTFYSVNEPEMITVKNCISLGSNRAATRDALISKNVVMKAVYDEDDLSYLYSAIGVYYFNKAGKVRKTILYDNGPDYFVEGMARTERNGKIGYFNKSLDIVIKPSYDFGFPFQKGIAMVCNGCKKKMAGEHSELVGGQWGAIDANGVVIEPLQNTMAQLFNKVPVLIKKAM